MRLLCLIGRHGAGKSTIGAELALRGYKHISVGLLRRLARARQLPSDIPYPLMAAMRRAQPGAPLQDDIALKLLSYASQFPRCVLDGFPVSAEHLNMLPLSAIIGVVASPRVVRNERLLLRAETSQRAWTPGLRSEREESLSAVIVAARREFKTIYIPNHGSLSEAVDRLWERLG